MCGINSKHFHYMLSDQPSLAPVFGMLHFYRFLLQCQVKGNTNSIQRHLTIEGRRCKDNASRGLIKTMLESRRMVKSAVVAYGIVPIGTSLILGGSRESLPGPGCCSRDH